MCVLACYWIRIKVYILNKVTIKYNEDTQHDSKLCECDRTFGKCQTRLKTKFEKKRPFTIF